MPHVSKNKHQKFNFHHLHCIRDCEHSLRVTGVMNEWRQHWKVRRKWAVGKKVKRSLEFRLSDVLCPLLLRRGEMWRRYFQKLPFQPHELTSKFQFRCETRKNGSWAGDMIFFLQTTFEAQGDKASYSIICWHLSCQVSQKRNDTSPSVFARQNSLFKIEELCRAIESLYDIVTTSGPRQNSHNIQ